MATEFGLQIDFMIWNNDEIAKKDQVKSFFFHFDLLVHE